MRGRENTTSASWFAAAGERAVSFARAHPVYASAGAIRAPRRGFPGSHRPLPRAGERGRARGRQRRQLDLLSQTTAERRYHGGRAPRARAGEIQDGPRARERTRARGGDRRVPDRGPARLHDRGRELPHGHAVPDREPAAPGGALFQPGSPPPSREHRGRPPARVRARAPRHGGGRGRAARAHHAPRSAGRRELGGARIRLHDRAATRRRGQRAAPRDRAQPEERDLASRPRRRARGAPILAPRSSIRRTQAHGSTSGISSRARAGSMRRSPRIARRRSAIRSRRSRSRARRRR